MSGCRFGVSPVNNPDPDPDPGCLVRNETSVTQNNCSAISALHR